MAPTAAEHLIDKQRQFEIDRYAEQPPKSVNPIKPRRQLAIDEHGHHEAAVTQGISDESRTPRHIRHTPIDYAGAKSRWKSEDLFARRRESAVVQKRVVGALTAVLVDGNPQRGERLHIGEHVVSNCRDVGPAARKGMQQDHAIEASERMVRREDEAAVANGVQTLGRIGYPEAAERVGDKLPRGEVSAAAKYVVELALVNQAFQ